MAIDLDAVMDTADTTGAGVPAGNELVRFASAVYRAAVHDEPELVAARDAIRSLLGPEALVEAAATAAIFHGLVRVADATGIQLDDGVLADSDDYRHRLGLDGYSGAANSATKRVPTALSITRGDVMALFTDYEV